MPTTKTSLGDAMNNDRLGPLTETFTAPSNCDSGDFYLVAGPGPHYYQYGPLSSDSGCMPSHWLLNGYYSPGVCPDNYTPACSGISSNIDTTYCCPHGDIEFTCAPHGIAYDRFGCNSALTPTVTFLRVTGKGDTSGVFATEETAGSIWAYSVQLRNAAPATSTASSSSTQQTSLDTNSSAGTASSSSSGLSKGAIAGIAVGAAAVTALLLTSMFLLWRRRQQYATRNEGLVKNTPSSADELREVPPIVQHHPSELSSLSRNPQYPQQASPTWNHQRPPHEAPDWNNTEDPIQWLPSRELSG